MNARFTLRICTRLAPFTPGEVVATLTGDDRADILQQAREQYAGYVWAWA